MRGLNQGNQGWGVNVLMGHLENQSWVADMTGSGRDMWWHG
jgi:hypothetical protein